ILNQKEFSNRTILIAGENFGCGSSREHAPWAIANYGFKVIIAPSFADIFYSNCAKNGIALIPLQLKEINSILEKFKLDNNLILTVDLSTRKVKFENLEFSFSMDDSLANRIINKLDDIEMTLKNKDKIEKFEKLNFY
ncbi:MAG: 3-isopropylmalate dehydratase small subunit, partial [Leptospiraceae bacterium]|nr:3-isopropylmalate dehydratase small subunit [Leptospiraceae bacterium]